MIGALLLPLIFAAPIWIWRWRSGRALGLSWTDARWWRAFAEYCLGYVIALAVFIVLNGLNAFRGCFLLVDSRCDVPFGDWIGDVGFFYLFLAGPLGVPALIFAVWDIRRRILAAPAKASLATPRT